MRHGSGGRSEPIDLTRARRERYAALRRQAQWEEQEEADYERELRASERRADLFLVDGARSLPKPGAASHST